MEYELFEDIYCQLERLEKLVGKGMDSTVFNNMIKITLEAALSG